ncbi:MAG: hypothetical protein AAF399_19900, partial [Bacteroidota bacterium]
ISQAQRTDFFVGKKVGKKPPKPHATPHAAPAPRASWPTRRCVEGFALKSGFGLLSSSMPCDKRLVFVHFEMELSKEYIKSLSREFRLTLMAWLVESFQEEAGESTDELMVPDELKAHLVILKK